MTIKQTTELGAMREALTRFQAYTEAALDGYQDPETEAQLEDAAELSRHLLECVMDLMGGE